MLRKLLDSLFRRNPPPPEAYDGPVSTPTDPTANLTAGPIYASSECRCSSCQRRRALHTLAPGEVVYRTPSTESLYSPPEYTPSPTTYDPIPTMDWSPAPDPSPAPDFSGGGGDFGGGGASGSWGDS